MRVYPSQAGAGVALIGMQSSLTSERLSQQRFRRSVSVSLCGLRAELGLSQEALAHECGINRTHLSGATIDTRTKSETIVGARSTGAVRRTPPINNSEGWLAGWLDPGGDLLLEDFPSAAQERLIAGARDEEPVRGLTHGFYKYPARFSPVFARAVIETFTSPGDLVLDPHVGGGTTVVEARATGREAIGVDISALAEFVTRVKCTCTRKASSTCSNGGGDVPNWVDIHRRSISFPEYDKLGYYKHLDHPGRWRLRKGIEQALERAILLGTRPLEAFGRCVVLRTSQWALDGRSKRTGIQEFRRPACVRSRARWSQGPANFAALFRQAAHASRLRS